MKENYSYSKLLPKATDMLPTEFYAVRRSVPPKASKKTMIFLAVVSYVSALVLFIYVLISTANNYTTENVIKAYDDTGNKGYTCDMISKVSDTYTVESPTDPTIAYDLVNIIESAGDCTADLTTAAPCSTNQTFFPGSPAPLALSSVYYTAVGMFEDVALMLKSSGAVVSYNYTAGIQTPFPSSSAVFEVISNTIGIDSRGAVYYLSYPSAACLLNVCVVKTDMKTAPTVVYAADLVYSQIFNDNEFNLYMYNETVLLEVSFEGGNMNSDLLLSIEPSTAAFVSVAVHMFDGARTIYYVTDSYALYSASDGVTTELPPLTSAADQTYLSTGIVTDGATIYYGIYYQLTTLYSQVNAYSVDTGAISMIGDSTAAIASKQYNCLAINPSASRLLLGAVPGSTAKTVELDFYYIETASAIEAVNLQSNFGTGWFTCGTDIVYPIPTAASAYSSRCPANGIVGQIVYAKTYMFTTTDATAYALRSASAYCSNLYAPICATVSDLPPYSCTRKVYPTLATIVGTAVANAHLLLSAVLFLFGVILSRLPKPQVSLETADQCDTKSADIEMPAKDGAPAAEDSVINPIAHD